MSLNMKNLLTHMHHNKLPKEYQAKEDPDAVRVSEYWGKNLIKFKVLTLVLSFSHLDQNLQKNLLKRRISN